MKTASSCVLATLVCAGAASAQTTLVANGPGETYELIESKGYGIEVPDCGHSGRHFSEVFDTELNKNVFVAHAHRDQDDDRCMNTDRQRTELRGGGGSLQGPRGTTTVYRWKVKLASGFRASPNFTHIMQIKAYGSGCGSGAPILTITPRNSNLELSHRGSAVRTASLSSFAGTWVEMYVRTRHDNGAPLDVTMRRVSDGATLLSYSSGSRDMWDDGCGYGALKLGIYRSLNSRSSLRDEAVRFADVCVARGSEVCPSGIGTGPNPTPTPAPTPTPGGSIVDLTPSGADVTASADDGNVAANTVDGSLSTRWSASGDAQWIQYDLGATRTVGYVRLAWYNGNQRRAAFDVLVGATASGPWTTVLAGRQSSGTSNALESHDFPDAAGRYVRIVGHGNNVNAWNSITETEIWGQ